jgi:hypothetical protein
VLSGNSIRDDAIEELVIDDDVDEEDDLEYPESMPKKRCHRGTALVYFNN